MLARLLTLLSLSVICTLTIGCGGEPAEETKFNISVDQVTKGLRSTLEGMKKSGQKSSLLSAIETDINGIKSTDKAKGEALLKLYVELDAAQGADKVKAICTQMLDLL